MLAVSRQRLIMEKLQEDGAVKVSELSELLQVSEKTIREDLEKLEKKGLLKRIHGGAVLAENNGVHLPPPPAAQASIRFHEKEAIAEKAVTYIQEGDIIALDGGSTTLRIAVRLRNEPLTVVTNDVMIIRELAVHDRIRLVVPGGYRHRNLLTMQGNWDWLRKLNIHKLFLSATGIHMEYGLTIFTEEHVALKQLLLESSKKVFCVADHSKFDKGALLTFAELKQIDTIITDYGLAPEIAERYRKQGIQLDIADPI
ncbi:DeoR family transcriptional regulator [Insulibacter thermoxylanivorax]|uniref:DeoR family transcriptional regulator n=1 Tax=Insulibacter thermoxylanivorax TaxID=2749268 RepID=A0A916QB14_9BACL|nr:DeoR/GlpR family DNA-binding transcription regulator [Insulibacter thermoxylanivorax]GFR37450.1 DeoR family transcriptional regulator [Insulibacter thermoxylanivorax]